jgi:tRNA U34 5-methylaminomethyl-2-thiouridine-forming methyltransferase MnmC
MSSLSPAEQPDFPPVETKDGSITFYSSTFGEWFHSREGAQREAQTTYVEASHLAKRASRLPAGDRLKILDICYGLGYNSAAALAAIWQVRSDCPVEIQALEIDITVAKSAIAQGLLQTYPKPVLQALEALAQTRSVQQPNLSAELHIGDARQQIQPLVAQGWQADVIFLDPFSPPRCPQLWSVEFLHLVARCLNPQGGQLVTYSCAAAVRTALQQAGLKIGSLSTPARKWPGTSACHTNDDSVTLQPLSQQEQEHLQTRAAVPYHDFTLQASAADILNQRIDAQAVSTLLPTEPWRKRWAAQNKR